MQDTAKSAANLPAPVYQFLIELNALKFTSVM
jgi:hypothetical protein